MSFQGMGKSINPMCDFLKTKTPGRNLGRLRPEAHRLDEFAASYSLAGCTPALPASASPAGYYFASASRFCKPPPGGGWGIFDRHNGEFSTGLDNVV
jgi:hypothetical protein